MNKPSNSSDKFIPQDAEPGDYPSHSKDKKTVLKEKDKKYHKKDAHLENPAKRKEQSEQPVTPNKIPPRD